MKRRILALVLSMIMTLSTMSVTALAEEPGSASLPAEVVIETEGAEDSEEADVETAEEITEATDETLAEETFETEISEAEISDETAEEAAEETEEFAEEEAEAPESESEEELLTAKVNLIQLVIDPIKAGVAPTMNVRNCLVDDKNAVMNSEHYELHPTYMEYDSGMYIRTLSASDKFREGYQYMASISLEELQESIVLPAGTDAIDGTVSVEFFVGSTGKCYSTTYVAAAGVFRTDYIEFSKIIEKIEISIHSDYTIGTSTFDDIISIDSVVPSTIDKAALKAKLLIESGPSPIVRHSLSDKIQKKMYVIWFSSGVELDGYILDPDPSGTKIYWNGSLDGGYMIDLVRNDPVITPPKGLTLTCTGAEQLLIQAGKCDGGKLEYAVTEPDEEYVPVWKFSPDIPIEKAAGVYWIHYWFPGTDTIRESDIAHVVSTIAHKAVLVPEKPAACGVDGLKEHYECSACGTWCTDAAGMMEIKDEDRSEYVIPAAHIPAPYFGRNMHGHWTKCVTCSEVMGEIEAHVDANADGECDVCEWSVHQFECPVSVESVTYTGEPVKGWKTVPYEDVWTAQYFRYNEDEDEWEPIDTAPVNVGKYSVGLTLDYENGDLWHLSSGGDFDQDQYLTFEITKAPALPILLKETLILPPHIKDGATFDLNEITWKALPEGVVPTGISTTVHTVEFSIEENILTVNNLALYAMNPELGLNIGVKLYFENYEDTSATLRVMASEQTIPATALYADPIPDQVYTGKTIKPAFNVYDGNHLLTPGKDYTVTYKNAVKAAASDAVDADGKSIAPTAVIKGKGGYKGSVTATFTILPAPISTIEINDMSTVYTGKDITVKVTPKYQGKSLKAGVDYEMRINGFPGKTVKDVKEYRIALIGKGNFASYTTFKYEVVDKGIVPISKVKIQAEKKLVFTGSMQRPEVKLTYLNKSLVFGEDYEFGPGSDGIAIGAQEFVVIGRGKFAGQTTVHYEIVPIPADGLKIAPIADVRYEGKPCKPALTVTYNDEVLTEKIDYTVDYIDNTKAGIAYAVVTGSRIYGGTKKVPFNILLNEAPTDRYRIETLPSRDYVKGGVEFPVEVRYYPTEGGAAVILTEGRDYKLNFTNCNRVGARTDENPPKVTVTLMGGFRGTLEYTYTINATDLSKFEHSCRVDNRKYTTKKDGWKQTTVTLTDINGKKLQPGVDYSKTFEYFADEDCTATQTTIPNAGDTVYMRISGIGNYTGSLVVSYQITAQDISTATVKIPAMACTGQQIRPARWQIEVKLKGESTPLTKDDFEIVEYGTNVKKGTGTVTIRGVGNYAGTKKVKFSIGARLLTWWYDLTQTFSS